MPGTHADLILHNGRIAIQDDGRSVVEALAIRDGRIVAVGAESEVMALRTGVTKLVDLNKRTVVPGLNDSHTHLIRGGLNYTPELRWDGVPSLADGLTYAAAAPAVRAFAFKQQDLPQVPNESRVISPKGANRATWL